MRIFEIFHAKIKCDVPAKLVDGCATVHFKWLHKSTQFRIAWIMYTLSLLTYWGYPYIKTAKTCVHVNLGKKRKST